MVPGIFLLIGLISALIILIILQVNHSRKEREEREWRVRSASPKPATGYSAPPPSYGAAAAAPAVKVRMAHGTKPVVTPRRQPATPQVTLYHMPMVVGKMVCPGCEGENDAGYSFCLICGQRIR